MVDLTLPIGKESTVKNIVFSILSHEYPLKLIDLTNFIRKRYGKSVTYQAVRKAAKQLVDEGVLEEDKNTYKISLTWVKESKHLIDGLLETLQQKESKPTSIDSIEGEISVFTFESLNKLMAFWHQIIDNWFDNFKNGDANCNCYQGAHIWEGLLHIDREKLTMGRLKQKGITSYALVTSISPLDVSVVRLYNRIGLTAAIAPSTSQFDKGYYVGTYGEMIVQVQYPAELVKELDEFYDSTTGLENMKIEMLSEIANKPRKMKMTVIKNLHMAKQINKGIIDEVEKLTS